MKTWIRGTGITAFGELWHQSVETLVKTAAVEALNEASLTMKNIDVIVVGNMLLSQLETRAHAGKLVADVMDFSGSGLTVEGACASGALAVRQGLALIGSGMARRVLVVGFEKMTDAGTDLIGRSLMAAGSSEEQWAGATFPSLYALMTRAYMDEYKVSEANIALAAVLGHAHAMTNPLAQFRQAVTIDDVLHSALIADPVRQLNASPISDGAAAVVLEAEHEGVASGVAIVGSGQGGDWLSLSRRESVSRMISTQKAATAAFSQANTTIDSIEVAEIHDCFSVALLMALEDLGICKRGQAGTWIQAGVGPLINPSGGLKACGHPVGATGVKQVAQIARQLRGGATWGLTHNVGGSGATAVVHVLKKEQNDDH